MEKNKLFRIPEKMWNKKSVLGVKDVKRIAVVGAERSVGTSFITGMLGAAFSFSPAFEEDVTIVELGSPYFFEAYGIEKKFLQRGYIQFYDMLFHKKGLKGLKNIEDNINWILRCPLDKYRGEISSLDVFRLIHNAEGSLLFFDCSALNEDTLWDILPEMDVVIVVIDPLPSKLVPRGPFIQRLSLTFPKMIFVVNKMNKGVHRGELCRFLEGIDFYPVPFFQPQWMYKAEYNCILPYCIPDIKDEMEIPSKALAKAIMESIGHDFDPKKKKRLE
ncbi:MAG: hypothetical protein EOM59_01560 [Clostridia bacterium]|nr:hypothetical protein [Clostridia bacterium]